jgi:hypothetical protein
MPSQLRNRGYPVTHTTIGLETTSQMSHFGRRSEVPLVRYTNLFSKVDGGVERSVMVDIRQRILDDRTNMAPFHCEE